VLSVPCRAGTAAPRTPCLASTQNQIHLTFCAPFWFDLLQRLIQLRGTATKPRTEQEKIQKTIQEAERGAP
jgi:hypothetical protein